MYTKSNLDTMKVTYISLKHKRKNKLKKILYLVAIALFVSAIISTATFYIDRTIKNAKAATMEKYRIPVEKTMSEDKKELLVKEYYTQITGNSGITGHSIHYCKVYNIEPSLFLAIMKTESDFNPNAINKNKNGSIDRGLCQLNNKTFPHLKDVDFMNPEVNIKHATYFLNWCLKTSKNNTVKALAFYNAGYGKVTRKKIGERTLEYINKVLKQKKYFDDGLNIYLKENSDLL